MANERITEELVREHFRQYHSIPGFQIEAQISRRPGVDASLRNASKSGNGIGRPEFIITLDDQPNLVIVIECKASNADHESPRRQGGLPPTVSDIGGYAVDGVLHYAAHLAKKFDVIAIAVSGQGLESLKVSTFRQLKGDPSAKVLANESTKPVTSLLAPGSYIRLLNWDPSVAQRSLDELLAFSKLVHNFMRDYAKLSEPEKPLVVSAVLLALRDSAFSSAWSEAPDEELAEFLLEAVARTARKSIRNASRRELMLAAYRFIATHPELGRTTYIHTQLKPRGPKTREETSPLRVLIREVDLEVMPFVQTYPNVDVVGQFYGEFLRYTGGDGKGLGIVLTPRHLTDLFVDLARIGRNDTVIDPCAGTGGFLISAMRKLDSYAQTEEDRTRVRERQVIGIEQRTDMYALCASNMILRGDGRSNLYRGSCFDADIQKVVVTGSAGSHARPTKGLLNPPFSQKGERQHELDYVKAMMDMLTPGGLGVAVVPMSCAIAPHPARNRLLNEHTLVATMSLPDELFYPVGITTCALVLRAGEPHEDANEPTWFGYWKNDGFLKTKNRGRQDVAGTWNEVHSAWVREYLRREETPGRCVQRIVGVNDEWCAEAYLETDYSSIGKEEFEAAIVEYALFLTKSEFMITEDEAGGED
ncbi:N-6 DNA methylase [Micromonospora vinacea]|uniref:HsdM family class I SAM-dependent methyltransferase n=1 Tax=Micromonospora vinacea TaxID=709878 RepID=UPI00344EDF8A